MNTGENKNITNVTACIVTILMTGAFSYIWLTYYNYYAFRTNITVGGTVSILIWVIIYLKFCDVYRSFKIASNSIGQVAFSQFLSVALSDLILYIASCLIARQYVDIIPGALTVCVQIIFGLVWAFASKRFFLHFVSPQKCLLVYDSNITGDEKLSCKEFKKNIEFKYGHLFSIEENIPINSELSSLTNKMSDYPVIFIYEMSLDKRSKIVSWCVDQGKKFYITPTIEDVIAKGYEVKHFIDTPIFSYDGIYKESQSYFGKRFLDIICSLLFIVLLSPFLVITAIAIKIDDPKGTILFKQDRVTQGGKVFSIYKFRSMVMDAEKDGKPRPAVAGDSRITKVGKIIRATRIDELPQLFNILKGDLSLVGPRPERVEHVDLYTKELPEFRYRLRVKAGLTGYAQIYGKYNTSAKDKLLLDLLYIEQQSFLMDLRILVLTIKIVFTPESTEGFEDGKSESINEKANKL